MQTLHAAARPPRDSYSVPTDVYALATAWNPQPEVDRLLHLCREAGVTALNALELGCGTGRLMRALRERGVGVCGIDLSEAMVERARRDGLDAFVADMSNFELNRVCDLIYVSANTIRHVIDDAAFGALWRCVARHLPAGGLFIADLELGLANQAAAVGQPKVWTISAGDRWVRSCWTVVDAPTPLSRTCGIQWTFEEGGEGELRRYEISFPLRCDEAAEFLAFAAVAGLTVVGIYENREPFLIPLAAERALGRMLVMLRKP